MKSPQRIYLLLDVRFKPARNPGSEGQYAAYFVVASEFTAPNLEVAFALAKLGHKHPIIEEKSSFWARIEAGRATANASRANALYQGNRNGHS